MTITVSSHRASQSREHRAYWLVAVALGCLVLAGCASQSATAPSPAPPPPTQTASAPPTSATYSAELCSAAAEYQTAANAIVHLDASKVGTDGVKAALQDLEAAANKLIASAQEQFGPQIAELERAIASLKGTIAGLTDQDSVSTNLGKITASVSAVEQAAKPIVDSVRTGCASVPPAETPAAS
jgi:PBP1b-binding outer membrane lipoprotein LpoB